MAATLLLAAHGTRSARGAATTRRLADAVSAARPDVPVSLCFLDVQEPSLATAIAAVGPSPAVVVPLLLSAGYHVRTDIPAVVAGRTSVRVARHLGPDPLVLDAVADRLRSARGGVVPATTLLAAVASSRASADEEVSSAAGSLAALLDRPVSPLPLTGPVSVAAYPAPVEVAPYLLAEGDFLDGLRAAVGASGVVADPLGAHPSLVRLVWQRYDEALAAPAGAT